MDKKMKTGFTIIELLMALALMAMLMAAVAFAFDASVKNYHANEGIHKTLNTARQALLRMTTDLRTAQAVALIGVGANDDPDNKQCSMMLSDGTRITYKFDNTDNKLYYITNDDTSDPDYVLCKNVTDISFERSTVTLSDGSTGVRNVRMILTVTDDIDNPKVTQTLATGTVVRKNL